MPRKEQEEFVAPLVAKERVVTNLTSNSIGSILYDIQEVDEEWIYDSPALISELSATSVR